MKNIIKTTLVLLTLVLVLAAFTGCDKECAHQGGEATCEKKAICELCGAEYGELAAHKETYSSGLDATCTEPGYTVGMKCSVCSEIFIAVQPISPTGHTLENKEGLESTCTEDGYTAHQKCTVCDAEIGKDVIPAAHTYGEADANGTKACTICGEILVSTAEGLQAALDNATKGTTIRLTEGVAYGSVVLGRPTKYNDTKMYCETHDFTTDDAAAFIAHLAEAGYHTTPRYTTTLEEITIIGAEGATIGGLIATSGHQYGDVYDYVRDIDYDQGSAYYVTLNLAKISFINVEFTGKVDINTSDADSIYDGVLCDGCSFTTGGIESANGAAIRYYNESNNGHVRNLIVNECTFVNCYQGIYSANINGIAVVDSDFDTTGHNAIAIQSSTHGAVDLKDVVITGNTFINIGDRIIRFGEIGADSNIIIQDNTATDSGDEDGEVMKAVSVAEGITTDINGNSWGGTVANPELEDAE